MADYADHDEWEYDFTKMTTTCRDLRYKVAVRDGAIGWISEQGNWILEPMNVQEAYLKWLDKQIYGDNQ